MRVHPPNSQIKRARHRNPGQIGNEKKARNPVQLPKCDERRGNRNPERDREIDQYR